MGVGHVILSERRKKLMPIVFTAVASTLARDFGSDIYYWVKKGNEIPEHVMNTLDLTPYDVNWWIGVKPLDAMKSHI